LEKVATYGKSTSVINFQNLQTQEQIPILETFTSSSQIPVVSQSWYTNKVINDLLDDEDLGPEMSKSASELLFGLILIIINIFKKKNKYSNFLLILPHSCKFPKFNNKPQQFNH